MVCAYVMQRNITKWFVHICDAKEHFTHGICVDDITIKRTGSSLIVGTCKVDCKVKNEDALGLYNYN